MTASRSELEWTPPAGYARSYGAANVLNQVASEAGVALTFNANGNLETFGTTSFGWTLWGNRLASASRSGTPNMTATYNYDSDDRRTLRTVNGATTRTLWSGADEVGEYDASGALLRRFIPDGSGAMDARLAAVEADGTVTWLHTNHQGSVVATSNASGAVRGWAGYSPSGELGTGLTAPPPGSPFGYTGRQWDAETGLWQYRARYYSPRLGQFLSTDPIGMRDDPNLYLYVGLDPVNNTDPDGQQTRPMPRPVEPPRLAPLRPQSSASSSSQASPRNLWRPAPGSPASQITYGPGRSDYPRLQAAQADAAGISLAANQPGAQFQRHNVEYRRAQGQDRIDFLVSPGGTTFPVPRGATGPTLSFNNSGAQTGVAWTGGNGGQNGQVSTMRLMNPVPARGNAPAYPNVYVTYQNPGRQAVDPYTGRTVSRRDGHYPVD